MRGMRVGKMWGVSGRRRPADPKKAHPLAKGRRQVSGLKRFRFQDQGQKVPQISRMRRRRASCACVRDGEPIAVHALSYGSHEKTPFGETG